MVKYGMTPLAAIQAGTLNGAKLLGWPLMLLYPADRLETPRLTVVRK